MNIKMATANVPELELEYEQHVFNHEDTDSEEDIAPGLIFLLKILNYLS